MRPELAHYTSANIVRNQERSEEAINAHYIINKGKIMKETVSEI